MAFAIDWSVVAGLSLSTVLALFLPPLVAWLHWKKTKAPWKAVLFGVATFFVSQVVLRLPWQIALGVWLKPKLGDVVLRTAWIAFSALTAALFEETGRFLAFKH